MKHNLLKSLIISVILLTGVCNAWGKTIYLQSSTSTGWAKDNAKFAIHYWKNGGAANWSDYMIAKTSDMYATEISDDATHVIVVRYNSNKTGTCNWNDVWNQTVTIELNGKNIIVDKGWEEEWDNSEQKNKLKNYSLLDGPYETKNLPKTIYFDNTVAEWNKIFLRIGRDDYSDAYQFTKVQGTANLYELKTPKYFGYRSFNLANSCGWTGDKKVDQPYTESSNIYPNGEYKITKRSLNNYYGDLDQDILFIPTSVNKEENNCTYYNCDFDERSTPHTQTVNFYQYYAGGTLSISYINEDGNKQTKTSGSFSVPQTCILTVESAIAARGYEFRNVEFYNSTTKQGDIKTIGETFIVRDARTIYPEFVTTSPQKVFLKINAAWEDYKHIKVYTWNNNSHLWVDLNPVNGVSNLFSCEIPAGYSQLSFVKLNGEDAGGYHWNHKTAQSIDLDYTPVSEGKNCFKLTIETKDDGGNVKYTGGWASAKVTLDPCNIGTYGIKYNGEEYLNDATTSIEVEMPYGSSFQIIDATPTSEHYIANTRYKTSIVRKGYLTEFEKDQTIEVVDDYNFAPNLVTKESHRVYLRIPNNLRSDWNKNSNGEHFNCIYLRDYLSGWRTKHPSNDNPDIQYGMVVKSNSHETFEAGEDELWYIDIPAGYHTFGFERKNSTDQGTGFTNRTIEFEYGIPLDGVNNCFTISRETDGGRYTGSWGPLPTCTITLGYPDIGRFGIIVDGETIYASNQNKRDTYITVPYGTEVQLLKGEPGDAAYTNNLVKEINGQKEYIIFGENETAKTFTVTSNVKFDDIFATKPSQTVFIAVPKNLDKWYNCSDANHKYGHDVYAWQTKYPYDYLQNGQAKQTMQKKVGIIKTDDYTYYQYTLDGHVYELDFQFKSAKDANGTWDSQAAHAGTKTSKCPPISTKNCFYLDGGIEGTNHVNGYTGYWDYGPPCKVEMGYTNIGRYGIKDYTGEIHYAIPGGKNTIFYVPYGTQVEVLEGEPRNDNYNGMVGIFNASNTELKQKFHDGVNVDNFVTITQDTAFDDLFVSKQEHIVYLGVPNEGFDNWRLNDGERMTVRHLWPRDYIQWEYVNYEEMFVIDDITYYKFTLPQGLCSFQFSHRQQSNDSQISASRHFPYQIPVTEYNCFILENRQDGNGDYDGYWAKLPKPNVGDYRVLYAEKELIKTHEEGETEDWETAFHTVYEHPSDIITKPNVLPQNGRKDIVSLHINTSQKRGDKTVHPMVILQQFQQMPESNTYKWANLQAHTVLPLKATGNMGMLPGRKKAFGDLPFYDDGIEAIKNDTTYSNSSRGDGLYKGSGVWNFVVNQASNGSVELDLSQTERYQGKYYIRTEALTNGWDDYTDNLMTYSDYADYKSGFSHYFCKWLLVGNNVKFTIANDYAQSISDPLYGDATDLWGYPITKQMVDHDQVLNEDANVRFAWYEMNNFVHRAYLGGSTHVKDRFLVVRGEAGKIFSHYVGAGLPEQGKPLEEGKDNGSDPRYGLDANEEIFRDDANWIYHADIQILPGCTATVTARHYNHEQTFIKDRTLVYGEDLDNMKNKYPIRLLYDFKINRLITGYIPGNNPEIEAFTTDLMLIRREEPKDEDSKVTQLVFDSGKKAMDNSNTRAYGVLELSKERLVNNGNYNDLKRRLYWISFPFDVRIADVFGSGIYAQHWIIQSYNGQKRADNGYYYETTESNWEYHFDPNTINAGDPEYQGVLKKGVGYVVALNLYNIWKDQLLENTKDAICLYFPSKDLISADIVQDQDIIINVPEHKCEKKGREIADSHWNVIGVPAYKNAGVNFDQQIDLSTDCAYYYRWDKAHNAYTPMASYTGEFSTLHAYMVQYYGGLNWTGVVREGTQSLAARSNTDHQIEHNLRLELQKDGKELDRTFVKLQENEDNVTSGFDFNYDLSKIINAGTNIYTIVKTNDLTTNVSGNVLPLAEDMVIPVGVVIDQAGEYTFSMPDGTAGIIAELIDYQTNTRTNLLLDNYTVTLPAGTNNSRFALSLQPDKTVTSVDNIGNGATGDKVKKYLIDGKLYLQKDGVLYDAQGHAL